MLLIVHVIHATDISCDTLIILAATDLACDTFIILETIYIACIEIGKKFHFEYREIKGVAPKTLHFLVCIYKISRYTLLKILNLKIMYIFDPVTSIYICFIQGQVTLTVLFT